MMVHILDTFDEFRECFYDHIDGSLEELVYRWERYIDSYPELKNKCQSDYTENHYDWKEVAKTRVFNRTKIDFEKMELAHQNIKKILDEMIVLVKDEFNFELDFTIVLYCGLGNGAGWVDTYQGKRAILFGIEKLAELNILEASSLRTLIAHELCHVVHFELRGNDTLEEDLTSYSQGIWQLYTEGFAQYYQSKLLKCMEDYRGDEWFKQCNVIHDELRCLFLEGLQDREIGIQRFFGDWFEVKGIKDTGYFLGFQLIEQLAREYKVHEIACLSFNEIEKWVLEQRF